MSEIHTWDVNVNSIAYTVIIAAEDNIAIDSYIDSIEDGKEYPYDQDTLFSFLYECAAVKGDVREYEEWNDPQETMVKIECLSFEMSDAE